jgi:Mg2+/Co2+ transporter CorB
MSAGSSLCIAYFTKVVRPLKSVLQRLYHRISRVLNVFQEEKSDNDQIWGFRLGITMN